MKHTLKLRSGAVLSNHSDGYVLLEIEDAISGIQIIDIQMSYSDFGKFIKGCGSIRVEANVRGLDMLGKKLVREGRRVLCPLKPNWASKKTEFKEWLEANCQEEGWSLSTYLGSQNSITPARDSNGYWLEYSVFKYVEITDEEKQALLKRGY